DRPKSINSTLESMEEPTSTPLSPGDELSPPHLLPKAKNFVSSRLEFSGKPILTGKHLSKQRSRRLSGQYPRSSDISASLSPNDLAPDFARSCPDHEPMNCFGLMSELMSAVDILSARQNQWCSSNDTKSTIQVLKAAQSSTLLFVQKSVDEMDEEAGKPKDLRYFDEDSACSVFFKHSTCYDVLPESGKLLVLDSTLPIRRGMQALIDHSLAAAPIWCSRLQCYTQLLTTGLCLRLLAQAFPLTAPTTQADSAEDDLMTKKNSDPTVTMGYWEGKTIGSVLNTFFNWAHSECPQEAVPEAVTVVTPQDHLYGVTRILTLATVVPTKGSASTSNVSPPPRYVMIADRYGSGNLLGLLNTDRLLAYLRVRMRNLPTPSNLNVNVGDMPGIRWEERGWLLADSIDYDDGDTTTTNGDGRSRRRRIVFPGNTSGNIFYLHPATTCREALHILNAAWSRAGLACLPVAGDNGKGFQGMFTKHDIIGTIFAGPLEVALNATVGTVMAVRPRHAGCTNQAMCFTSECLVAVLDRMFRQKAPCLAVFEKPNPGASWNGQGALGPAIGVITSSDLLHTIVLDAPTPPSSAASVETPDDVSVQKGAPAKVTGGKSATYSSRNKRFSLPVDQIMANSVSGTQATSPFANHQLGLTRIFHRSKRYSEGEISPLEGPYATTTNSHAQRSQTHQSGRGTQRPTEETSPANQQQQSQAVDDGTLFEMDECV
ncbi:5'-AMP-activated protein kinase subunit gamma-2, partial [Taenia solium]